MAPVVRCRTVGGREVASKVADYLREVRSEMKKVQWPTRRETLVFTAVVIVSVLLVGLVLWVMDLFLGAVLRLVV